MGDEPREQAQESAGEAPAPKWGDPLDTIPPQRQQELRELAQLQQAWAAQPDGERKLEGSTFRGTDLNGSEVFFLAALALAGFEAAAQQIEVAGELLLRFDRQVNPGNCPLHLEGADLVAAHLEGANLTGAHLEGANLTGAHLEQASLSGAHLERASLSGAYLENAFLSGAHLQGARLQDANLEGASVGNAHLEGASLGSARLQRASLNEAYLDGVRLAGADLKDARLVGAHLEGANLVWAQLQGAWLRGGYLQRASLVGAHLEGANLEGARLEGADLRDATFDVQTTLNGAALVSGRGPGGGIGPRLADVRFNGLSLIVLTREWEQVRKLADEIEADKVPRKKREKREDAYAATGRAYRLLATALREQGLTALATRFHYRAELMDRKALYHRGLRHRPAWLISWLLGTFAGYGDRVSRLFATYGVVITVFACLFWWGAHHAFPPPTSLREAVDPFILSVTSFHGRGLQPHGLTQNDTVTALSGLEAVFGLLIEGLFIAAFTRRVTGS